MMKRPKPNQNFYEEFDTEAKRQAELESELEFRSELVRQFNVGEVTEAEKEYLADYKNKNGF